MIRFTNDYTNTAMTFDNLDISEIKLNNADAIGMAYEVKYYDTVLFHGSKKEAERIVDEFLNAVASGYDKYGLIQIHSNAYESVCY